MSSACVGIILSVAVPHKSKKPLTTSKKIFFSIFCLTRCYFSCIFFVMLKKEIIFAVEYQRHKPVATIKYKINNATPHNIHQHH